MKKVLFLTLFLNTFYLGYSQKYWFMGNNTGLQFSTSGPVNFTAFTPSITSTILPSGNEYSSPSASAMDNSGNLVFYTDGKNIWDWNNNLITSALLGGNSPIPLSVVVVPKPCTCDTFFVFTNDFISKKTYASMVVKTPAGLIVAELNQVVYSNTNPGGYFPIAAMYNAQLKQYWVISESNSAKPTATQTVVSFRAIPVTCNTKSVMDITQGTSSNVSYSFANNNTLNAPFSLKFSNAGTKLGYIGIGNFFSNVVGVLDFDKATGIVSQTSPTSGFNNSFKGFIPQGGSIIRDIRPYDIEFSPNDTKLYVSAMDQGAYGTSPNYSYKNWIYKFDITALPLPPTGIPYELGSYLLPYPVNGHGTQNNLMAHLALAPDGKIYFSKYGSTNLGRIDNPNAGGFSSTFNLNAPGMVFANGAVSTGGLPNIVKGYFADVCPVTCGTISVTALKTDRVCTAQNGSIAVTASGGAMPYQYSKDGGISFSQPTSNTFYGLAAGQYTIVVKDANGCVSNPLTVTVCTAQSEITINTLTKHASCNTLTGSSTVTAAGGTAPYTYIWNTLPTQNTQTANGLPPGNYTVTVTDNNGCTNNATVSVITEPCPACGCGSWNALTVNNINNYYCGATINWSCNADFTFMSSYSCCNQSVSCTPAYNWDIKFNGTIIKAGTVFNNTVSTFKPIANGVYTITLNANCNGISCNPCIYYVNVSDCPTPPDCCTGGSWTSKKITWSTSPLSSQWKSDKEIQALLKEAGAVNPSDLNNPFYPKFPEITKCDSVYHLSQNGTYTLNAAYSCNPNLPNCTSNVKVRINGPAHSGLYNAPVTKTFTQAGNYTITYIAYCGNIICDSCKFTLAIDKDCCLGSGWISKTYTKVNLDYSSSAPAPLVGLYDLPIGIKPVIYAPKAVNVMLNFKCADGCGTATFQLLQKDLTNNVTIVNTTITGTIASIYTYAKKTRIWIRPVCGGKQCGNPLIFDIQCNARICPAFYPNSPALDDTKSIGIDTIKK